MRIAIVGDLQLKGSTLDAKLKALDEHILPKMRETGVEFILCAGDFWERGEVGDRHKTTLEMVLGISRVIRKHQIPWLIVPGNHDYAKDGACGLDYFEDNPLVLVKKKPCTVNIGNVRVACWPWPHACWTEDPATYHEWLDMLCLASAGRPEGAKQTLFLGHVELTGSLRKDGPYAIPLKKLEDSFDWVYLAHIHTNDYPYTGLLWHNNFGEEDVECGFMLADLNKGTERLIHLPVTLRFKTWKDEDVSDEFIVGYQEPGEFLKVRFVGENPPEFIEPYAVRRSVKAPPSRQLRSGATADMGCKELFQEWLKVVPGAQEQYEEYKDLIENEIFSKEYFKDYDEDRAGLKCIKSLRLKNIGVFEDESFEFSEGINAIYGPNGSGKTTLLESAYAGLFGRWPHEGRHSLSDMVSAYPAEMEVVFETRHGDDVRVVRKFAKGKSQKAKLTYQGKEVTGDSAIRAFVQNTITGDPRQFSILCFLDQNSTHDLVSATKSVRMDVVGDVLGVRYYDWLAVELNSEVSDLMQDLREMEECEEEVKALDAQMFPLKHSQVELASRIGKLDAKYIEVSRQKSLRTQAQHDYWKTKAAWKPLSTRVESLETRLKNIQEYLRAALDAREVEPPDPVAISRLEQSLDDLYDRVSKAREAAQLKVDAQGLCNAGCKDNPLPCIFIERALKAQDRLKDLEELEEVAALQDRLGEKLRDLDTLRKLQALSLRSVDSVVKYETECETVKSLLQEAIEERDEAEALMKTAKERLEELSAGVKDLEEWEEHYQEQQQSLTMLEAKISLLEEEKGDLVKLLNNSEEIKLKAGAYAFVAKAFSREGIPQLLIDSAMPHLAAHADEICRELFDERFHLTFSTVNFLKTGQMREGFDILFRRGDSHYDVRACSGGEAAAVRVIIRLAFNRYLAQFRGNLNAVLFMDEPCANQDAEFRASTLEAIREGVSQVVITTHVFEDSSTFANKVVLGEK